MSAMQQAAELRRAKEQFVSNLHGTTKWEVFCAVSCLPLCLLIGEELHWQEGRWSGCFCLLQRLGYSSGVVPS
jgi:hypothetical protein